MHHELGHLGGGVIILLVILTGSRQCQVGKCHSDRGRIIVILLGAHGYAYKQNKHAYVTFQNIGISEG